MNTTEKFEEYLRKLDWFLIAQVDFGKPKTLARARKLWDDDHNLGHLHCEATAAIRSIVCSHSFVLNDTILTCLREEYRTLAATFHCLHSAYNDKQWNQFSLSELNDYRNMFHKNKIWELAHSDFQEVNEMLGLRLDPAEINHMLKEIF